MTNNNNRGCEITSFFGGVITSLDTSQPPINPAQSHTAQAGWKGRTMSLSELNFQHDRANGHCKRQEYGTRWRPVPTLISAPPGDVRGVAEGARKDGAV